ncbi:hypothetical protein MNBD_GAMMA16-35 [hydrothermal vent metagenome]|uniref:Flagellar hook-length control protein-like C-terminal domain-containing protein n=1 Tax=hydrothermal vent metagenome TaxID=652676 RepID=A0A3B0ZYG9_9ZZZZ
MQGSIQNSVTSVLAINAPESRTAITETSNTTAYTKPTSFSEMLGSATEKPLTPMDALVSTIDLSNDFEAAGFTGQLLTDNGEVFPLDGQKLPVIMEAIPNFSQLSSQQQNETAQGFAETSTDAVQLDMQMMSEQQALTYSGQALAQEKLNEVRTVYSSALNGALQGGTQQQLRNFLNQSGDGGEIRSGTTAPFTGEGSLFSENELLSTPNSAKLVDGLLRIGEPSIGNAKLITNESALLVQSSGFGEPISSQGIMNPQNILDKTGILAEIKTPVNHPEWKADLGERVAWMANNKIPTAEIKINPVHLGPIEIKVSVSNEQATVSMIASHGATREALEAAIPRLRDILSDSGLQLADADVNSQHPDSEQSEHQASEHADTMNGAQQNEQSDIATNEIHITPISSMQNTGVDIFA